MVMETSRSVGVGIICASPPSADGLHANLQRLAEHPRSGGRDDAAPRLSAAMNEPRSTILVVEDDRHTRTFLADNLAAAGHGPIAPRTPVGRAHVPNPTT